MADAATLPALLNSLTQSLVSAQEATPKITGIEALKDGISLLDVKNELLISYLQNLVFLILLKLRSFKEGANGDTSSQSTIRDAIIKKLVELRAYIEKGVRPLENRLQFQIEKVIRAAEDAERSAAAAKANKNTTKSSGEREGDGDESEEGSSEEVNGHRENGAATANTAALQHRPKFSSFTARANGFATSDAASGRAGASGVYRPPKVMATKMPTTDREERKPRKQIKSSTLDEFITDELSTAPVAQPSIGTNIVQRGRRLKTASERKDEEERRNYEEMNFVRLPKDTKKERAKKAKAEGQSNRMSFGGEEWVGLGEGVDRIERLTKRKEGSGGTRGLLQRSRKRAVETVDGPRSGGDGADVGGRFQKRLKIMEGRKEKRR